MPANSFGELFTMTSFGESHGTALGVVVDGCPAGIALDVADFLPELARRRPGQSELTSARRESDTPEIVAGIFDGKTTVPAPLRAGVSYARQTGVEHDVINPNSFEFVFVEIELKA